MGDKLFNVAGLIVVVALVMVVVTGKNSAAVIKAIGAAFTNSIQAATGQKVK